MKLARLMGSLLVVLMLCSAFTQKKDKGGVYVAGVAASFCDTVIYFTDVQLVDNIELKNKMLPKRSLFSGQLKEYVENKYGTPNQTCFVYFGTKKEKLAKSMKKMQEKYRKEGKMVIRKVEGDFKFSLSGEEE